MNVRVNNVSTPYQRINAEVENILKNMVSPSGFEPETY